MASMVKAPCGPRPFTASVVGPSSRKACVVAATRRVADGRALRTRSAEAEAPAPQPEAAVEVMEPMEEERGGFRRARGEQDQPQFKHFLPLPKPAHLVYIKPTVAVVAGLASRSSVGLKMTAGDNALERYVIEFYSRSVK